jgi:tetrahydromethanopterin S-methyltransferase subunit G
MEAMREAWTDGRLDDLNHRVDELSQRVERGFSEVHAEFGAQNRMFIQFFAGLIVTLVLGFAGMIVTLAVQL